MSCDDKKDLYKQGFRQVSRKYRMVARLPEGKTGLEALAEVDPRLAKDMLDRMNNAAAEQYLRCYAKPPYVLTLSVEEFDEFKNDERKNDHYYMAPLPITADMSKSGIEPKFTDVYRRGVSVFKVKE